MKNMYAFPILVALQLMLLIPCKATAQHFSSTTIDDEIIGPAGLCSHDMDEDGKNDIIVAGWDNNSIEIYHNDGQWTKENVTSLFSGASYVVAGDIDGDETPDIIASGYYEDKLAWFKYEDGSWQQYPIISAFEFAHEVAVFDMDQDGDLDVLGAAATSNEVCWCENTGIYSQEWPKYVIDNQSLGSRSVDARDIDGDGDIDIAAASLMDNSMVWYRNNGGINDFTKITIDNAFTYSHKVQIIDMNNDGHPDLLGTGYQYGIKWWENNGGDSIVWIPHDVSSFATAVIALGADLNNDGYVDIVATSQGQGRVARWINIDGTALNWRYGFIQTFQGAWPIAVDDYDLDGDMDFAVGGFSSNEVRCYENDFITVGINEQNAKKQINFTVFPNPAKNIINIEFDGIAVAEDATLTIYNHQGKRIDSINLKNNNTKKLNIAHLSKGVYVIKINSAENEFTETFIKQ
jgi:hypothetical protein